MPAASPSGTVKSSSVPSTSSDYLADAIETLTKSKQVKYILYHVYCIHLVLYRQVKRIKQQKLHSRHLVT